MKYIHKSIIIKERIKIYEESKRISAYIAAVLMAVTVFTSAIPAYAAGKSATKNLRCGNQVALCSLESSDKRNANAITTSTKVFDYIQAFIAVCEVDSRGEVVKYRTTEPNDKTNAKSSGKIAIKPLNSTNYFENIASGHAVVKGSSENSLTLDLHW